MRTPSLWAIPPGTGSPGERARASSGDPDDLHQLVVDHGDAVFRLAYSVVRDRALAEDVTQDTMLKAWLALPSFRGDSSMRGWIMRIAHNTAISTLRSRRAFVTDPIDLPEATDRPQQLPEHRVEQSQAMTDFEAALDTLDDLSRSVVVLREIEGLAYEEIARLLDVPLPTVKTRLLRARRKLASALREWS
ncbi:MAG: RNA polymerase sigma factor [Acidimicrobiales bacterium]